MTVENPAQVVDPPASTVNPPASDKGVVAPGATDTKPPAAPPAPTIETLQAENANLRARQSGADSRANRLEQDLKTSEKEKAELKAQLEKIEQERLDEQMTVLTKGGEPKAADLLKTIAERGKSVIAKESAVAQRERAVSSREEQVTSAETRIAISQIAAETNVPRDRLEAAAKRMKFTSHDKIAQELREVATDILGGVAPVTKTTTPTSQTPTVNAGPKGPGLSATQESLDDRIARAKKRK